ncbi:MAG TPA: general secretion pathway protein GspB [Geobacteraceae bacterium]|nr:general secretion pathway protein GspB [Geobacteraceae bacterium]
MSFILDALKKLEQEKTAQKNGAINVSDEILRDSFRQRRKTKRSLTPGILLVGAGFVLILLLGIAGTFFWMKHEAGNESKIASAVVEKTAPAEAEVKVKEPPTTPKIAEPNRAVSEPMPAVVAAKPSPPPMETWRNEPVKRPLAQNSTPADFRNQPSQPYREVSGASYGLTVSGIAWQDDPSARRAVVNGSLVNEGASVGSATVDEIQPTRVCFSSGGRRFAVSISGPLVNK